MSEKNNINERFAAAIAKLPMIAVMRGIKPEECQGIGHSLYNAGFRLIEVPLNSPDPLSSIAAFRSTLPNDALVGAGTVLDVSKVAEVKAAGGEMIFMPHADTAVIKAAKEERLICVPGIATPTEAFAALAAGADALKIFPAELITPRIIKAIGAVLPKGVLLLPFGGITPDNIKPYVEAGAGAFGLGSALYTPGMPCEQVLIRATGFVEAWQLLAQKS